MSVGLNFPRHAHSFFFSIKLTPNILKTNMFLSSVASIVHLLVTTNTYNNQNNVSIYVAWYLMLL